MVEYEFALILETDPDEEEADRLYSIFDDGTIATIAGVPRVDFHRAAATLPEAVKSAIHDVTKGGLKVKRVEMEPEVFVLV